MKAVIDRFEGDFAVLLLGNEEIKVDFPKKHLPKGSREGSWLTIGIALDPEGEKQQREKITKLIDKLKNKGK